MPSLERSAVLVRASQAHIFDTVPANYPFSWHQSEWLELLKTLRERTEREGVSVPRARVQALPESARAEAPSHWESRLPP